MGSTTVICTDKTGTITENKFAVHSLVMNLNESIAHEKGIVQVPGIEIAFRIAVLCNNAWIDDAGSAQGNPTEGALLLFSKEYVDITKLRRDHERVQEYPFDSKVKKMITVNRSGNTV